MLHVGCSIQVLGRRVKVNLICLPLEGMGVKLEVLRIENVLVE